MMKILIVSDSHRDQETLERITKKYQDISLKIHCGDSDVPYDDPSISTYINVRGNHDDDDRFPIYQVVKINQIKALVIHGHKHGIWKGYDQIVKLAKQNGCKMIFHGHTHIPHVDTIDQIFILNPGSLMFNRGNLGYGSYVLLDIDENNQLSYHYYDHELDQDVTKEVLEDGIKTLEELKPYIQKLT